MLFTVTSSNPKKMLRRCPARAGCIRPAWPGAGVGTGNFRLRRRPRVTNYIDRVGDLPARPELSEFDLAEIDRGPRIAGPHRQPHHLQRGAGAELAASR